MNNQKQSLSNPAIHEAGQGPVGDSRERFAGGGANTEHAATENAGGTDTGMTGDDTAGGSLTGESQGNALNDPTQSPSA